MDLPILIYGSPCWSPNVHSLKRLESVQKYATTVMVGSNEYKANLLETNLLPISLYLQLTDLLVLFRFIQGYYDVENRNFVESHSPNRQTRCSQYTHFVFPLITKSLCENNFWVRCPKLVNRLPTTAKFFEKVGLKPRLLRIFWTYFRRNYDVDRSQT